MKRPCVICKTPFDPLTTRHSWTTCSKQCARQWRPGVFSYPCLVCGREIERQRWKQEVYCEDHWPIHEMYIRWHGNPGGNAYSWLSAFLAPENGYWPYQYDLKISFSAVTSTVALRRAQGLKDPSEWPADIRVISVTRDFCKKQALMPLWARYIEGQIERVNQPINFRKNQPISQKAA